MGIPYIFDQIFCVCLVRLIRKENVGSGQPFCDKVTERQVGVEIERASCGGVWILMVGFNADQSSQICFLFLGLILMSKIRDFHGCVPC